ncbi:MAG: hypothetical protein DWC09_04525 [Candidatus Poseidoniales archaeon]|nr:MAG: hypothetical protein DWC09_04525 [Candidatus Poseidoniales archaeon]
MAEKFPSVTGRNLNKKTITVPDDYNNQPLLVIAAFEQWQQRVVDEVIAAFDANNLGEKHTIIEIPVIQRSTRFRQMRLDAIMRAVIRDRDVRQRTITVYLDKKAFRDSLDIPNDSKVHWFLIDHVSKEIRLRGQNVPSSKELSQLVSLSS